MFLLAENAEIQPFKAWSPFSELGFSLTLALWFTQSGTFARQSQVSSDVANIILSLPRFGWK
jgi:hypothetical protein